MRQEHTELEFSGKYDEQHSLAYFNKHQAGFWRRQSHARDVSLARKALKLAGNPDSILDLPCGAGRFWPMLTTTGASRLLAADNSQAMLDIATRYQPPAISERFETFQTSAFAIELPDASVDNIFCMRLIHHVGEANNRMTLLREFHRVCRQSVCISLWVDGNLQAHRRRKLEASRKRKQYQNRFITDRNIIESEFAAAGFRVTAALDFLPLLSIWRVYVLEKDPQSLPQGAEHGTSRHE